MNILVIVAMGLVGCFLCVVLKNLKPEFGILITVLLGVVILGMLVKQIRPVLDVLAELMDSANIDDSQIKLIIKIISISYVTEFGSAICIDAGQSSIANKINLAGKVSIVFLTTPLIMGILNLTKDLL